MSKVHSNLERLARGKPKYESWQKVTVLLDGLSPEAQSDAVDCFEAASTHWPTGLDPWTGFSLEPGIELRRSPTTWVKEVYLGQHAPKHRCIRILESPRRPMRGQKLANLLSEGAETTNLSQVGYNQQRVSAGYLKSWKGEGAWQQWQALRLWTCELKPGPLKALVKANLTSLSSLNLTQNHMGPAGAAVLVKAPGFSALTGISLDYNRLGSEGAGHLARADWMQRIERLDLAYNGLDDVGLAALVEQGLPALRWLSLADNPFGASGAWMAGLPALEHLDLSGTQLTDAALTELLGHGEKLSSLVVKKTGIGDAAARSIAGHGPSLKTLDLSETKLTPTGLAAILTGPVAKGIRGLRLREGLDMANAQRILDGACPKLKKLWWHGPSVAEPVSDALKASGY
ncbi:MAG: hypothetical protein ACI8RZ_004174 [Myxococcota bacterium]|jgi:hypothetical protein